MLQIETVSDSGGGSATPRVPAVGEVDYASAPLLGQALAAATERGSGEMEVDLAEVTFFDCAGPTVLERADGAIPGRLRLVAASAAVRQVLGLFDMQQRFTA